MMKIMPLRLMKSRDGSAAVEFALIAPLLFALLLGVLQIGVGMQNYNAIRAVSADVARYAVINYQTGNRLSRTQLQDYTYGVASAPPYGLQRNRITASVTQAEVQRVTGATEYTIQLDYTVPSVLGMLGVAEIPMTYTRAIFVIV